MINGVNLSNTPVAIQAPPSPVSLAGGGERFSTLSVPPVPQGDAPSVRTQSAQPPVALALEKPAATPPAAASQPGFQVPARAAEAAGGSSVSSSFLAQLIGQGGAQTQAILAEYEKLVAFGNVRYKPSNAFKPAADPVGVFGKLLRDASQIPDEPVPAAEESIILETPLVETAPEPELPAVDSAVQRADTAYNNRRAPVDSARIADFA